jgi:hypothetical protein
MHTVAPICQLFHTIYIYITNAIKDYSHLNVLAIHARHQMSIAMLNCGTVLHITVACGKLSVHLNYNYKLQLKMYFKIGQPY